MRITQTSNSWQFPWRVDVPNQQSYSFVLFEDVEAWMRTNMQGRYLAYPGTYLFEREQDVTMFMLRWS